MCYLYTKEIMFSLAHSASLLFGALWVVFTCERLAVVRQAALEPDAAICVLDAV